MSALWALAMKDLRLLLRDRAAVFLTFAWPLVLAAFFGALGPGFGGLEGDGADEGPAMQVLAIDEDRSRASVGLLRELDEDPRVELIEEENLDGAREAVRLGEQPAYVRVVEGRVELGVDPRRQIEAAALRGALELAGWRQLGHDLPGVSSAKAPPLPVEIELRELRAGPATLRSSARPPSPYAVTFPQGIIWAVLACAATFAVSLVAEHTRGTLVRLAVAPLSRTQILAGKALACLVAIGIMELFLVAVAVLGFGVRPTSWPLLILALASTAFGFVGVMSLLAVLGRKTTSAAGLSWAILMVLAMLGGGMLPLFLMPDWLRIAATASPVAWALSAIEGAVWRGYGLAEMAWPCAGLLVLGGLCLLVGARSVREL